MPEARHRASGCTAGPDVGVVSAASGSAGPPARPVRAQTKYELHLDKLVAGHNQTQRCQPISPVLRAVRHGAPMKSAGGGCTLLTATALSSLQATALAGLPSVRRERTGAWAESSVRQFFKTPHQQNRRSARLWRRALAEGRVLFAPLLPLLPPGESAATCGPYPDPCPKMRTRQAFRLFLDALSVQLALQQEAVLQKSRTSHTGQFMRSQPCTGSSPATESTESGLDDDNATTVVFTPRSSVATTVKQVSMELKSESIASAFGMATAPDPQPVYRFAPHIPC